MSLSAFDLVRTLAESRVLDTGQLEELQPLVLQFKDGASLAKQLMEWGWLTGYQVDHIFAGNAKQLVFGEYRLIEHIGQGGMGEVFKAAHMRLNRTVALKTIRAQTHRANEKPDDLVRRFQREAQAIAQLLHPNIVILFDYNQVDERHFIAMEYVDGVDLMKMVQTQGPLSIPQACNFIRQAAQGLQHAFEYGMVHRDIKPSNLLVTKPRDPSAARGPRGPGAKTSGSQPKPGIPVARLNPGGVVKILDLGLVRMTESLDDAESITALTMAGTVIGTPDYISPEQARDATKVDIRADLYSLGCTFYFLLTGRPPFPSGSSVEKLFKHQNEPPIPLENIRRDLPAEVLGIVQRLMSKRPESRFQTPADMIDAINELSADHRARNKTDLGGPSIAAAAEAAQAERAGTQVDVQTQMFSPETLVLPAKKAAVLEGHRGYVTALAFNPDGRLIATGGVDGYVHLWDVGMARPIERPLNQNDGLGEVQHLMFSPTGKVLYSGSSAMDGHNWRWEWTGPQQMTRHRFQNDEYRSSCFAVSPDGQTIAAGSGAAVLLYDAQGKKPSHLKGHVDEVRAVVYSSSGKRLYSAGTDKRIVLWEPSRFWNTQRATMMGHKDTVSSLSLVPDGSLLASGSADGTICLWDAAGEATEPVATLTGHTGGVRIVRFVSQGNLLLSVGDGGQVCLWEVTEQTKIREWQIEKSIVHSVAVSPEGRFVAVGLGDGTVSYYDLELYVGSEHHGRSLVTAG